jgi:hypothetical protein
MGPVGPRGERAVVAARRAARDVHLHAAWPSADTAGNPVVRKVHECAAFCGPQR